MLRSATEVRAILWPANSLAAQNIYRGVVAKKPRNRRAASPARAGAARPAAPAAAGVAAASRASASTAQLTDRQAVGKAASYPGQRFGLPEQGPRSVAGMGRRFLALIADWLLCLLIVVGLTHPHYWTTQHLPNHATTLHLTSAYWTTQYRTLALFAIEVYALTALIGTTVGKRLLGLRVIRTDGRPVGFGWAAVRTLLLLTVIPPLLTDRDLRGLHDRAADTIVVRI